jgi:hypothetical protein
MPFANAWHTANEAQWLNYFVYKETSILTLHCNTQPSYTQSYKQNRIITNFIITDAVTLIASVQMCTEYY